MNGLHYVGIALLVIGGILLLWTLRALVRRRALLRNPVKVEGVVIHERHVLPSGDSVSAGKYYVTVRYETRDGKAFERNLPAFNKSRPIGAVIPLVYQRDKPENVVDAELRWTDLVTGAIGSLIFLGIGAALYFGVEGTQPTPAESSKATHNQP